MMRLMVSALLFLGHCPSGLVDANTSIEALVSKAKRKFKSYQSDPLNLLRGIQAGEYDRIYIQYHQCVWSELDSYSDNYEESGCSGDENGGDKPWYMGNTQCYRANVAYSLYGVRAGDESPQDACRRRYYINTFFTSNGIEEFGDLVGLENHEDATTQCTLVGDEENGDDDADGADYDSFQHNTEIYPNAQSYTTFCADGRFVNTLFGGAYCTGKSDLEVLDPLDDLNSELMELECALVYTAENENNGGGNDVGDENENARKLEEGEQEGDEGDNDQQENSGDEEDNEDDNGDQDNEKQENEGNGNDKGGTLWNVLSHSSTCSILEYPNACPDPYRAKKHFDMNPRTSSGFSRRLNPVDWFSLVLFVLGSVLLAVTLLIEDRQPEEKKSKRKGFFFTRPSSRSRARSWGSRGRSRGRSRGGSRGRSREHSTGGDYRSHSGEYMKDDTDKTIDTNDAQTQKKKKGGMRGIFSKKK